MDGTRDSDARAGLRISLRSCAKTFADGTRALNPTDLEIPAGETLAILGPSGCGKTTLLRLIAGLERPDSGGTVLFDDRDVTRLPIEKRGVGMVFQSYALFPNMTVAGNVGYGLRLRRWSRAEREARVEEMLRMVRISHLAERRIDMLSGGQRQRVALARALAIRPAVLLLDEPLTALDASLREDLRSEIDALLRGLGITAIYVTHDQGEAMALGDRVVVMRHGEIAQIGSPRDIYIRPANAFVAAFVGTLNRLEGQIEEGRLRLPGGTIEVPDSTRAEGTALFGFRPEEARLLLDAEDAPLRGRVASAFFLGDRLRVSVEGITREPLVLEADNSLDLRPGDLVGMSLSSKALLPLDSAAQ